MRAILLREVLNFIRDINTQIKIVFVKTWIQFSERLTVVQRKVCVCVEMETGLALKESPYQERQSAINHNKAGNKLKRVREGEVRRNELKQEGSKHWLWLKTFAENLLVDSKLMRIVFSNREWPF